MPFVPPKDRVLEHSTSNSQSVFTVTGAIDTSYNAFSASMSVGDTTVGGVVEAGTAFKSGLLTYSALNEITVTTAYDSKGTFSAGGAKEVFMGLPAADAIMVDGAQALSAARRAQARANISAALKGHLFDLTLSAAGGSASFGIAAGECADSTAADLMVLGSAYTKTTASWAVGSGNGGLDTGATGGAASTWYHVFLIKRPDTGVVDGLFSLSPTAPTLPANYTLFRRIGAMKTDGSKNWTALTQFGDEFHWSSMVQDVSASILAASTAAALSVPTGVQVTALMRLGISATSNGVLVTSIDEADIAPFSAGNGSSTIWAQGTGGFDNCEVAKRTNTSAQIRWRGFAANGTFNIATYGWIDTRGRLA